MMQGKDTASITDAEWEVMRVIWTKEKCTSKEVCQALETKKAWKQTTIKTLLGRLVKKDLLQTEKDGNKYWYSAKIEERKSVGAVTSELLGKICSRKVGDLIVDIIGKAPLSFTDIAHITAALKEKEEEAVDEVPCNCVPGQCQCHLAYEEEKI